MVPAASSTRTSPSARAPLATQSRRTWPRRTPSRHITCKGIARRLRPLDASLKTHQQKSNKSAFRYEPSAQPRTINHSLSTAKYRQGEICIVIQPSTIKKQHSQAQPSTGKQSEASKHSQAQTSTSNHSQAQSSKAQHSQARSYKIASRAPRRQTRG